MQDMDMPTDSEDTVAYLNGKQLFLLTLLFDDFEGKSLIAKKLMTYKLKFNGFQKQGLLQYIRSLQSNVSEAKQFLRMCYDKGYWKDEDSFWMLLSLKEAK